MTPVNLPEDRSPVQVWDLPVRIVHWSLAAAIPALWWTGESGQMDLHMAIGVIVLGMVTFRLLWGFYGSSTARFSSFVTTPGKVLRYLRGTEHHTGLGHNPAGAYSVLALIGLLTVQTAAGLFAGDPDDGATGPLNARVAVSLAADITEAHEAIFYVLLGLVLLHVGAVAWYQLMKRQQLIKAMLTGRRDFADQRGGYSPSSRSRLLFCVVAAALFAWWLWTGAPLPLSKD